MSLVVIQVVPQGLSVLDSPKRGGQQLGGDLNTVAGYDMIESRKVVAGSLDCSHSRLSDAIVAVAPTAFGFVVFASVRPMAAEEGQEWREGRAWSQAG